MRRNLCRRFLIKAFFLKRGRVHPFKDIYILDAGQSEKERTNMTMENLVAEFLKRAPKKSVRKTEKETPESDLGYEELIKRQDGLTKEIGGIRKKILECEKGIQDATTLKNTARLHYSKRGSPQAKVQAGVASLVESRQLQNIKSLEAEVITLKERLNKAEGEISVVIDEINKKASGEVNEYPEADVTSKAQSSKNRSKKPITIIQILPPSIQPTAPGEVVKKERPKPKKNDPRPRARSTTIAALETMAAAPPISAIPAAISSKAMGGPSPSGERLLEATPHQLIPEAQQVQGVAEVVAENIALEKAAPHKEPSLVAAPSPAEHKEKPDNFKKTCEFIELLGAYRTYEERKNKKTALEEELARLHENLTTIVDKRADRSVSGDASVSGEESSVRKKIHTITQEVLLFDELKHEGSLLQTCIKKLDDNIKALEKNEVLKLDALESLKAAYSARYQNFNKNPSKTTLNALGQASSAYENRMKQEIAKCHAEKKAANLSELQELNQDVENLKKTASQLLANINNLLAVEKPTSIKAQQTLIRNPDYLKKVDEHNRLVRSLDASPNMLDSKNALVKKLHDEAKYLNSENSKSSGAEATKALENFRNELKQYKSEIERIKQDIHGAESLKQLNAEIRAIEAEAAEEVKVNNIKAENQDRQDFQDFVDLEGRNQAPSPGPFVDWVRAIMSAFLAWICSLPEFIGRLFCRGAEEVGGSDLELMPVVPQVKELRPLPQKSVPLAEASAHQQQQDQAPEKEGPKPN
jgi:hypothetical protein